MSGWISSKLKVAETIDQQAAESLGNNEKPRSDESNLETPKKSAEILLPLKDQLKKKTPESITDSIVKSRSGHHNPTLSPDRDKEVVVNLNPSSSSLTDSDWTQLLSATDKPTPAGTSRSNGVSVVRGSRNGSRRQGSSGSYLPALEGKRSQKAQNSSFKSSSTSGIVSESKVNGGGLEGRPSDSMCSARSSSSIELQRNGEHLESGGDLDGKDGSQVNVVEHRSGTVEDRNGQVGSLVTRGMVKHRSGTVEDRNGQVGSLVTHGVSRTGEESHLSAKVAGAGTEYLRSSLAKKRGSLSGSHGGSDLDTDSDSDSGSTSDSEDEPEREERRRRREQILAERAAAKAIEAIKERENMFARLEGEKESLEKILEERAKQQAQERIRVLLLIN
ncbi:hypothetical protein RJ639_037912 [Escallonia herrerae]|uniref:Golgin candidate 2 n=1 Tax=Escallonia herrerae TaxID=1293975 RepID=A0AA89BAI4_9ASTE|nr:hypothetical protein RJ639_037912 [Escallonia herrerae]